jgi:predicted extracellular nuclease
MQIAVRSREDIRILGSRCEPEPDLEVANELLITEVADPENLPAARFVELQNPTDQRVRLDGWSMERYTNDGLEPGSVHQLDGFVLEPMGLLVIARDSSVFRQTFGFLPGDEAGRNSVADSNGDDNLLLRRPDGSIADLLGRIGEDGSGTDHEFEDGRAYRRAEINSGNEVFDPTEWIFWNDTGASGTLNLPQQAPQDYDPGQRN